MTYSVVVVQLIASKKGHQDSWFLSYNLGSYLTASLLGKGVKMFNSKDIYYILPSSCKALHFCPGGSHFAWNRQFKNLNQSGKHRIKN